MARTSRAASIAAGLKRISLRNSQRDYVGVIDNNDITFCYGPAGTSKTFTACYTALKMLQEKQIKEIILCKPIQEAGEKLGHLPGGIEEKVDPYMKSYKSNIEKIIGIELTKTLFDKIWSHHLVNSQDDGTCLIYIDRHLVHEVTSPQAWGLVTS